MFSTICRLVAVIHNCLTGVEGNLNSHSNFSGVSPEAPSKSVFQVAPSRPPFIMSVLGMPQPISTASFVGIQPSLLRGDSGRLRSTMRSMVCSTAKSSLIQIGWASDRVCPRLIQHVCTLPSIRCTASAGR